MRTLMRLFLFLLLITFLPSLTYADDFDTKINKACLRHAVSLVARLKSEVIGELSQNQSDKALKLATESCQAYFSKEFSESTIPDNSPAEAQIADKEEDDDWFTTKLLEGLGDSERKDGNKRLMKKR